MNLFLPVFPSDLADQMVCCRFAAFFSHKKKKYYAFSNTQVNNEEIHIVFDFDAKFLWDALWKSVL